VGIKGIDNIVVFLLKQFVVDGHYVHLSGVFGRLRGGDRTTPRFSLD